jgi:hypothetical protein
MFLICRLSIMAVCFLLAAAALLAQSGRPRVIIYYANETPSQALESANYKELLSALPESKSSLGKEVADSLVADGLHFPVIVARDVADLSKVAQRVKAALCLQQYSGPPGQVLLSPARGRGRL